MMKYGVIEAALIAALLLPASMSLAVESKPVTAAETKAIGAPKTTDKGAKAKNAKASAKVKLVDINSASKKELKTLPDIGDAEADKIIAGRPYLVKAQLATQEILPRGVYENLKTRLVARQKKNPVPKSSQK